MNTPTLISPLSPAGGTTPALPGQTLESADGTFGDALSTMLAGAQAQPLLPVPNPVAGQTLPIFSLTIEQGINSGVNPVGPETGEGGLDLLAPPLSPAMGVSDNLQGSTAQQPGSLSEPKWQNDLNTTLANAGRQLPNPLSNPAESLENNVDFAEQLALLKNAGSLAIASQQENNGNSVAIAAAASLAPDDSALPEQAWLQPRQALASQTNDKIGADSNIRLIDQRGQERPIDPSSLTVNPALRPVPEREARPLGLQPISAQPIMASNDAQRAEAGPSVQVNVQGTNAPNAVNPAMQAKVMTSMLPANATADELPATNVQPVLPDAEQIDIFRSEIGHVEPVGTTSSKPQAQQVQTPHTQIALQIARAIPQGIDRLSVQLHPAELGSVQIQLDFAEDGHVSALITAERPETLDLLQRDSRALAQSLNDTGLKLENGGLSFSLQQEQHQQGEGFNASSRQQSHAHSDGRAQDGEGNTSSDHEPARISQRLLDIRT